MDNKFTILLVDADNDFQDVITDYLKNTGTNIVACNNGKEAQSSIQGQKPDLVLMSDTLKDITGLSFCRKLKTNRSLASIPVVMILSSGRSNDREYCYQAGCSDVLVKPVDRGDFYTTLRKFVKLEKRFTPRFRSQSNINCSLQYTIDHDCRVFDISNGGLFLESCPPLPINTVVSLNFVLPESTIEIGCTARVAWINHPIALSKIDFPFGVGVEFVEMSKKTSDTLTAYLNSHGQQSADTPLRQRINN